MFCYPFFIAENKNSVTNSERITMVSKHICQVRRQTLQSSRKETFCKLKGFTSNLSNELVHEFSSPDICWWPECTCSCKSAFPLFPNHCLDSFDTVSKSKHFKVIDANACEWKILKN